MEVARQFRSPLIYILIFALASDLFAAIQEGAHGFPIQSAALALILLLNAGVGEGLVISRLRNFFGSDRYPIQTYL